MSAPQQQRGESGGGAPPDAGRDSASQPAKSSTASGSGHSGTCSHAPSPNNRGHFNNRVHCNHNQRQTPYPKSNYGNQDRSDTRSSNQERQEREYTNRTEFRERNTRFSDERHSGRYTDYHRRNHYNRFKPWRSEGRSYYRDKGARDSSKSRYDNDVNDSSEIRQRNGHNCDPNCDASIPEYAEYNQSFINHNQTEENKIDFEQSKDQGANRTSPTEQLSDISKQSNPIALEGDQNKQTNELKESSCSSKPSWEINETSKASQFPDQKSKEQSSGEELNVSEYSDNHSGAQASQSIPRIQLRPLTKLLRQELFAVTQENRLIKSPPPSASPASPSRLAFKPNLRNRRRTVSNCIYNAGSCGQIAESEAVFNDRIASMDKESLKYIINNGDTIFEPHLQLQARRRIRDEIRRQLKTIELDKPKDCLVTNLVEDEIVDSIKLPAFLLEEIENSSDEELEEHGVVDMDIDEHEGDIENQKIYKTLEVLKQSEPVAVDDVDSDDSASSQSSSKSTKRRRRLKLQNDAENVVDSFEKLILPHLREALSDRYRRQHSSSLQSRLHFISCVVTSSEHNAQTFSKIEVAKMQMNLKAADNRQAIEFLLREIVNVVSLQKQRRREQDEEQKLANLLSPRKTVNTSEETPKTSTLCPFQHGFIPCQKPPSSPARQSTTPIQENPKYSSGQRWGSASQKTQSSPARQSTTPIQENPKYSSGQWWGSASQKTQSSPARQTTPVEDVFENPFPNQGKLPSSAKLESFKDGLPFLSMDSTLYNYSRLASGSKINEPFGNSDDMEQHLVEIERQLMKHENRYSFLDDIIIKFQKEKSEVGMVILELKSRKFLIINSMASRNKAASAQVADSESKPHKAETAQESAHEDSFSKGGIARRTRSRLRRTVLVLAPKRQVRVQKRVSKKPKSSKLVEKSHEEIAEQTTNKIDYEASNQLNINEDRLKVSAGDQVADYSPTAKLAQSRLSKPSIAVNPTHQPLAIIPPLPPPPPPPEPICHMSYEAPSSFLKETPHEPGHHWSEVDSKDKCSVDFVTKGKLQNVGSPITQIKIYREHVIAAAEDGDIYVFHLVTHKLEQKITKHSEAITNMFLSEKDSILYTTSADGFFKKSSLLNLERVFETVYLKEPLQSMDVAWGLAFIGSRWGQISTFNVVTNKVMEKPLVSTGQSIIAIKATKEGVRKILVLGCKGNFVQMHDAGNGLLLRHVFIAEGLNVYSLLLDEGHIYCGTQKNEIYQLEFVSGNLVAKFSCGNGAVAVASYGDRYLLVGCYDGYIYVLNKITGTQVGRFAGAGRMVLALSVVGDKIVTSSKDNSLEILEVPPDLVNGY
ncbi:GM15255 [Drosophila sechellia]|uniref:GM15255 n=1 Tax=Drosophila sechellia TaxID=7238 RepID=B4IBE8_DROSE|nr:GM15255 [Drosophila sechellia]